MTLAKKRTHPLVRNNHIPRTIASLFYILATASIHQNDFWQPQIVWLLPIGLIWPHIARWLAEQSKNPKRQEVINMHIDALASGVVIAGSPELSYFAVVLTIVSVNALFVGSFRLMASMLAIFAAGFLTSRIFIDIPYSLHSSVTTNSIIFGFVWLYFCCFAWMGYNLSRRFIRLNREIKTLSKTDALTDCFNRMYLDKQLVSDLSWCLDRRSPLTVIFADLDHFKKVNDNFGHHIGDEVLRYFVRSVKECIRNELDWVARFGGEEFIVVLPCIDIQGGLKVADRIRDRLAENSFEYEAQKIPVTCSFGLSSTGMVETKVKPEALLARADAALYRAKAQGRNRIEITEP